jgi:putative hydrolase of the HAD superfamily
MKATKYKHLFFDLDRTLWDFDTNNKATFSDLFKKFELVDKGITDTNDFYIRYQEINFDLWERYKKQEISKEELNFRRFYESLLLYNIDDSTLAKEIGAVYINLSPQKTTLYPKTHEILESLRNNYQLHIITNGFEEVQYVKIEKSGLEKYFDKIITSERAGYKKPDRRIFDFALQETGADISNSIIIGDDPEADIMGAREMGMDQIWVKHPPVKNSLGLATYEVNNLIEIMEIL